MPGDEDGLQLVLQVSVADRLATPGRRGDERGEQAARRRMRSARLAHHTARERVDRPERATIATGREGRRRQPPERTPQTTVHVPDGYIEGIAERVALGGANIAEARPDDDRLTEAPHRRHHVDGLAPLGRRPPALEQFLSGVCHNGREPRVLAGLKCGLYQSPSLAPAVAIDDGQALAEERAHAHGGRTLGICVRIVLQYLPHVVGMSEQMNVLRSETHGNDVAVATRAVHEEAGAIASRSWKHPDQRIAGGPRGTPGPGNRDSRAHATRPR